MILSRCEAQTNENKLRPSEGVRLFLATQGVRRAPVSWLPPLQSRRTLPADLPLCLWMGTLFPPDHPPGPHLESQFLPTGRLPGPPPPVRPLGLSLSWHWPHWIVTTHRPSSSPKQHGAWHVDTGAGAMPSGFLAAPRHPLAALTSWERVPKPMAPAEVPDGAMFLLQA